VVNGKTIALSRPARINRAVGNQRRQQKQRNRGRGEQNSFARQTPQALTIDTRFLRVGLVPTARFGSGLGGLFPGCVLALPICCFCHCLSTACATGSTVRERYRNEGNRSYRYVPVPLL